MFDKILVPIDGSSDSWVAVEHAITLAKEEDARILGLYIADERVIYAPCWSAAGVMDPLSPDCNPVLLEQAETMRKQIREQGEKALKDMRQRCVTAGVEVETTFESGVVNQIILDYADQVDLVVMGRHGAGGKWSGPLLGSTFEAVARHASVPVLATTSDARPLNTLLVAYDGSDRAKQALTIGLHLASRNNRQLVLLTVDDGHGDRPAASFEAAVLAKEQGVDAKRLLVKGHVAEEILKAAAEENADLILMGAFGHSRFLSALLGSTVDDVVHSATIPVMVCR
jgi:nucleotide-binding universal stress UspA family protein